MRIPVVCRIFFERCLPNAKDTMTILADSVMSRKLTFSVLEAARSYELWDWQTEEVHLEDGTHASPLPVSKQPKKVCGGVPIVY